MNLLSINNIAKLGREEPLFSGVTFGLNEGEKAAIVGRNGEGKSTLLGIIAGTVAADEGDIVFNRTAGVSFLPQNPVFSGEDTIRDHIFKSDSEKLAIIRRYEELCEKMGIGDGLSGGEQIEFEKISGKMDSGDLWNYEAQVRSILGVLGIHDFNRKMGTLSGGMLKKVALAQVLVEDTKILLLDEPTNHLDITTIYWLQNYLAETKRAVLMVTHDRYFLDAVCNNIYELARKRLKLYQGNYSEYLEKKAVEAEIEANTERRIESVLRFERDWLLRGPCARGTKAKARIQRDMQLINREKFQEEKGFTFQVEGRKLGGKILELRNISKSFPKGNGRNNGNGNENANSSGLTNDSSSFNATPLTTVRSLTSEAFSNRPVITSFSYTFSKNQRIGIFGDNGSGKSTLLNIITGNLESDTGKVVVGVNTHFGYYQQNPVFKDLNITVLDYIKEAAEVVHLRENDAPNWATNASGGSKSMSAALFLEEFGFKGKIQHSPLSSLSGGERKRVFLVRLLMENPNFLILDEPTNDFDIFTMNILEKFLEGFTGCLLIVSHDRYFMDKVADSLFIMEDDGSISGFVGKCSEYIEYREEKRRQAALEEGKKSAEMRKNREFGASTGSATDSTPTPEPVEGTSATTSPKKKLTFKEQKEFSELEEKILIMEEKLKELEPLMSSSDFSVLSKAGEEYKAVSGELETAYVRWEELAARG